MAQYTPKTWTTGETITAAELNAIEAAAAAAAVKADADAAYDAKGAATTAQAAAVQRANHTGTQSADTLTDGTTNKAYTSAEKTKLAGVATAATANATDAALRDRSTHTGTQPASTVAGLATVATSGAYTDLTAKPTIPTVGAAGAGAAVALSSTDASVTNSRTPTAHTHPASDLTATGTRDATTFLRGDNTWATPAGGGGASSTLTPTATKTAAHTAAVGDLAVMNVAGGATALTLPTAPADKSMVGFLAIGATTAAPLTVNRGGTTDTLGPSGATSVTAVLANEVTVYQYDAANTRWLPVGNVKPQSALDGRYPQQVASAKVANVASGHITAHRGGGSSQGGQYQGPYPEETLEAFRAAAADGAQSINVHARLLADGTVVCMHDNTVDRTTNSTGNVNDYTLSAWRKLTWDTTQPGYGNVAWTTYTFPTLDEVVREFGGKVLLMIESAFSAPQVAGQCSAAIVAVLQKYNCADKALIMSFSANELTGPAAAGVQTMYLTPNYGTAGADVASITTAVTAANSFAPGAPKWLSLNGHATVTATVATTAGSNQVVASAGTAFTAEHVGALVLSTTGLVPYSTIVSVQDATHATLSANALTTNASVTMTWNPLPGYIANLNAAGYRVMAYMPIRRWYRDWMLSTGLYALGTDEPKYLAASTRLYAGTADPLSFGVWPQGVLPADQGRGRGTLLNGGLQLDFAASSGQQFVIPGHLCPIAAPTAYTINATLVFDQLDTDTSRWAAIQFACPDDRMTSGAGAGTNGNGYVDGYLLLIRQNGQVQLAKCILATQNGGTTLTTQTGPVISAAATSVAVTIQVTATQIILTLVSGGTTYGPWTVTDSSFRGGYFHVGKGVSSGATKLLCTWKGITVA